MEKVALTLPAVVTAQKGAERAPLRELSKGSVGRQEEGIPVVKLDAARPGPDDLASRVEVVGLDVRAPRQAARSCRATRPRPPRAGAPAPRRGQGHIKERTMIAVFMGRGTGRSRRVLSRSCPSQAAGRRAGDRDGRGPGRCGGRGPGPGRLGPSARRGLRPRKPGPGRLFLPGLRPGLGRVAADVKPAALLFCGHGPWPGPWRPGWPPVSARPGRRTARRSRSRTGRLVFTPAHLRRKAFSSLALKSSTQLATLRPNVFPLGESVRPPASLRVAVDVPESAPEGPRRRGPQGRERELESPRPRSSSRRPRPQGTENFALLRELRAPCRAAVGASRSAVDFRLDRPAAPGRADGKTVSPNLYVAVHLRGHPDMAGVFLEIIVAQQGPRGADLQVADYGIVGDLFEVCQSSRKRSRSLGGLIRAI